MCVKLKVQPVGIKRMGYGFHGARGHSVPSRAAKGIASGQGSAFSTLLHPRETTVAGQLWRCQAAVQPLAQVLLVTMYTQKFKGKRY